MKPRDLCLPLVLTPFFLAPSIAQSPAGSPVPGVGEPGGPGRDLSPVELETFVRGRQIFDHNFHRSDGVGSFEMNADSCRGCHQDPVLGGAGGLELNVSRFGRDFNGTGSFQDLAGGQAASKLRPPFTEGREEYNENVADVFEQRQTPSILGLGLLDQVSDAEILSHADPTDLDGDGIRGFARIRTINGVDEVGRFGWKAQVPRLRDFAKDAMAGELGITTPDDGRGFAMLSDVDGVADPEMDETHLDDLTFFMAELGPPLRTGSLDPEVLAGEMLFDQIGCTKCHLPALTGPNGDVPAYTDLLLHRVQVVGFRGMGETGAGVGIYRTPPLWGISDTAPYWHDGRAETLRDAINEHFREGQTSKDGFNALSPADQDAVLAFLNDL